MPSLVLTEQKPTFRNPQTLVPWCHYRNVKVCVKSQWRGFHTEHTCNTCQWLQEYRKSSRQNLWSIIWESVIPKEPSIGLTVYEKALDLGTSYWAETYNSVPMASKLLIDSTETVYDPYQRMACITGYENRRTTSVKARRCLPIVQVFHTFKLWKCLHKYSSETIDLIGPCFIWRIVIDLVFEYLSQLLFPVFSALRFLVWLNSARMEWQPYALTGSHVRYWKMNTGKISRIWHVVN